MCADGGAACLVRDDSMRVGGERMKGSLGSGGVSTEGGVHPHGRHTHTHALAVENERSNVRRGGRVREKRRRETHR